MKVSVKTPPCPECNKRSDVEVDEDAYIRWANGELIQVAFPHMSPDDRELLITGTHPECWAKIFEGMEE